MIHNYIYFPFSRGPWWKCRSIVALRPEKQRLIASTAVFSFLQFYPNYVRGRFFSCPSVSRSWHLFHDFRFSHQNVEIRIVLDRVQEKDICTCSFLITGHSNVTRNIEGLNPRLMTELQFLSLDLKNLSIKQAWIMVPIRVLQIQLPELCIIFWKMPEQPGNRIEDVSSVWDIDLP